MAKYTSEQGKKTWVVTKRWEKLSREQQIEEVRQAMRQGCSNKSAATLLGATPGMVAGIRFKNNIPSTNKSRVKDQAAMKPEQEVATKPAPYKKLPLSATEATQCNHIDTKDRYRCGGEREPGSKFCIQHQADEEKHTDKK